MEGTSVVASVAITFFVTASSGSSFFPFIHCKSSTPWLIWRIFTLCSCGGDGRAAFLLAVESAELDLDLDLESSSSAW
jgi:hypothetical protein